MIKIYLAGSTREPERIQGIAAQLDALGCYELTHRWWLGAIEAKRQGKPMNPPNLGDIASACLLGIREAEWLVLVSPLVADGNIGRWIELGYAMGVGTKIAVIDCEANEEPSIFLQLARAHVQGLHDTLVTAQIASTTHGTVGRFGPRSTVS